jgi:hypothetical protein
MITMHILVHGHLQWGLTLDCNEVANNLKGEDNEKRF